LKEVAKKAARDPKVFLEMTDIFGELRQSQRFVEELELLMKMLYDKGARETLDFVSK